MAAKSVTFTTMWSLIHENHKSFFGQAGYNAFFPPELQIAIFWEENKFQNTLQLDNAGREVGPAIGFGQVQPDAIWQVNHKWQTTFNADGSDVLQDDLQSVQLSSLLLAKLWEDQVAAVQKGKQANDPAMMRAAALWNYAGGSAKAPASQKNGNTSRLWVICMQELQKLHLGPPPLQVAANLIPGIKKSLSLVKGGWSEAQDGNIFP
jgi:hypothetical protein